MSVTDFNNLVLVPNSTFRGTDGHTYQTSASPLLSNDGVFGDVLAITILNATNATFYAAVRVTASAAGTNLSLSIRFNDRMNNNTFSTASGCAADLNIQTCLNDFANGCVWNDFRGTCEAAPTGMNNVVVNNMPPPDCGVLPQVACKAINSSFCSWNPTLGKGGLCTKASQFDPLFGFTCTEIINLTVCNNEPFTQKTGLCSWNTTCYVNKTKTIVNIPQPPTFTCDASNYISNQTACGILSDTYYLPCGFDNTTSKCTALFFDVKGTKDFGSISSQGTCQGQSGAWKTETTFDPLTNKLTSENWCEFGITIKPFSAVGGSSRSVGNEFSQQHDCNNDCNACMYNATGGQWPNASVAQTQCTSSSAGCAFRTDSNCFNGLGWCFPSKEFGGFDCSKRCGDCNLQPSPQTSCTSSPASCTWDNTTRICSSAAVKGCSQDCTQCYDSATCTISIASGGCKYDSTTAICSPRGGATEICYDGTDNDNNGLTDCADPKCALDPFCTGGVGDKNKCSQYNSFRYGIGAQGNCTATTGCLWSSDSFGFSSCSSLSDQCFSNQSLQVNQTRCTTYGGGNICQYKTSNFCSVNSTFANNCFGRNQTTCGTGSGVGCQWNTNTNFCDIQVLVACDQNQTLQQNENVCNRAGCVWMGNMSFGVEGSFRSSCVNRCNNPSITTEGACSGALNGTSFPVGSCAFQAGFCLPKSFGGGCMDNEGDLAACVSNDNCAWVSTPFGPMRHPNGSVSRQDFLHSNTPWLAIGLDLPVGGNNNESLYVLNRTGAGSITLIMANFNAITEQRNVSRLVCNKTIDIMRYNWSSGACQVGTCNAYATASCAGATLHYDLNLTTKQIEALWEVPIADLVLDSREGNTTVTDITNSTTVTIDGSLREQINESASALDGTNATRVRTSFGFCMDKLQNTMFGGMEDSAPAIISSDPTGGVSEPTDAFLDIASLGVKKTGTAFIYGIVVRNIAGSIMCKNVPLRNGGFGTAANGSKYYLYLDTDGSSTSGCSPESRPNLKGFEYQFKYIADVANNQLTESLLSLKCVSGSWVATSIPFKVDKNKACSIIGGPIFAIDKDTLTAKSDVNSGVGWRAFAAATNATGNASNVFDTTGPGRGDFKGIDFKAVDCTRPEDKDDSQCSKFKQFGFFPGEFGPACTDKIDNDGDGLTDCADPDCKFDKFFCQGSFAPQTDDITSPSLVWTKVNDKVTTNLGFFFDTDEPSQGKVDFYMNDSQCSTLNRTLIDKALEDSDSLNDYRTHHIVTLGSLTANTTYYFKYNVCDISSNCGLSACTNITTPIQSSNITFRIALPTNWTMDMPSINLTNFSSQYALKASSDSLSNTNISINAPDGKSLITFVGISIFEKQTLNLSGFVVGSDFIGIDSNQYQSLKQKTGVEKIVVSIPTTGNIIQHCDDSGENCQDVTSSVPCVFGSNTTCTMTDAVGLGFSSYKGGSSGGTKGGGGTSGGGSVGGGGTGGKSTPTPTTATAEKTWVTADAGAELSMTLSKEDIAIKRILISVKNTLAYFKILVKRYTAKPEKVNAFEGTAYQYLSINKENAEDTDIASATVHFVIKDSWLKDNKVGHDAIALYRYNDNTWSKLATRYMGLVNNFHDYEAMTPGFSYFVIGTESIRLPEQKTPPKEEPKTTPETTEITKTTPETNEQKHESLKNIGTAVADKGIFGLQNNYLLGAFFSVIVIVIAYVINKRRK